MSDCPQALFGPSPGIHLLSHLDAHRNFRVSYPLVYPTFIAYDSVPGTCIAKQSEIGQPALSKRTIA